MNGGTARRMGSLLLAAALALCLPLPHALAAGAAEVLINQATLTAATPYWANGAASAQATLSNWNAYFDAATSTLTLKNAVINTLSNKSYQGNLAYGGVMGDGDYTLTLLGDSSITYSGTPGSDPTNMFGVFAWGRLTVQGSGTLDIRQSTSRIVTGLYSYLSMTLNGGVITMDLDGTVRSDALVARFEEILVTGGQVTAACEGGIYCKGLYAWDGMFRITGGSLTFTANSTTGSSYGIDAYSISLEGGTIQSKATGTGDTRGLYYHTGALDLVACNAVFTGDKIAIMRGYSAEPFTALPAEMNVYAAAGTDGSGKWPWYSPADGELTPRTYSAADALRYVEFSPIVPQTGDAAMPWLWAGVALIMLIAGMILGRHTRKKC